jgi:hypothetical protein
LEVSSLASGEKNPEIVAVGKIHEALLSLEPDVRSRVLESVRVLLDMPVVEAVSRPGPTEPHATSKAGDVTVLGRPKSLAEVMEEANPGTNAQRIVVFATYREKFEGRPRFSRSDLEQFFASAHLKPPANYDRDFVEAVKKGWIHEDGSESYVTSKGLEAVASGFAGERRYTSPPARTKPKRAGPRKKAAAKKAGSGRGRRKKA